MNAVALISVNWIGDTLMSMPAVQIWRRRNPDTRLICLAKPLVAGLWRLHAAPQEVYTLAPGPAGVAAAARLLRGELPARAYVLPHSFRAALVPWLAGIPERVGMPGHSRDFLLTQINQPPPEGHQSREYMALLGLDGNPPPPRLRIPGKALAAAENLLNGVPHPRICLLPGAARGPAKRWPPESFAAVARRLAIEGSGIVICGGRDDIRAAETIAAAAGTAAAANLCGRTNLENWAAVLNSCDMVVCNDSGGMHLAAAVGTPVVALFGATDPARTAPLGAKCVVLQKPGPRGRDIGRRNSESRRRLADIKPDEVITAAAALLQEEAIR